MADSNAHRHDERGYGYVATETRDPLAPAQPAAELASNARTSEQRWVQWQEKGVRHDARVARNMVRIFAALALAIGAIWASVSLF